MRSLVTALKRVLRHGMILLAAVLFVCVSAAAPAGDALALLPCGFVCEDAAAADLTAKLESKGFLLYAARETMEADLAAGKLDCGAILRNGIAAAVEENRLEDSVTLLTTPASFLTELYRAQIHAVLFTASAPARTIQAAKAAGVSLTREYVEQELQRYYDAGYRFTFAIETAEGTPVETRRGNLLQEAAAALLLTAILVPGIQWAQRETRRMSRRMGYGQAFRHVLLPMALWITVLPLAAAAAAMGHSTALLGFCLALTGFALAVSALHTHLTLLTPGLILGGLALYPIYFDPAELFPWVSNLRRILPPCWLRLFLAHPGQGLAIGFCAALIGLAIARIGGRNDRI